MEYDPSDNSNLLFQVGADIFNLLLFMIFYIFTCIVHAKI